MNNYGYVYLDYAASAPLRPEACETWNSYHNKPYGIANPNSLHTLGRCAAQDLEHAKRDLAQCLGGGFRPTEILMTSGGTESNNLAVLGLADGARLKSQNRRNRVILSAIEHDSVLDVATLLRSKGFEVELVMPNAEGFIDTSALNDVLNDSTALVSVMAANNETGVVQPISDLAKIAHESGAVFHCDAIQAFGRIPLSLTDVDAVSIAAHKIGGPIGVGALALHSRAPFVAQTLGGGQEGGKRPGTQDVAGACAFAKAATIVCADLEHTRELVAQNARFVYNKLCTPETGIVPTAGTQVGTDRLPGIVSIMVPNVDSETLVLKLDDAGFEVSAGSACSSGSLDPSHVLSAMGIDRDLALGALRISFDERVSREDLDAFCEALLHIVACA